MPSKKVSKKQTTVNKKNVSQKQKVNQKVVVNVNTTKRRATPRPRQQQQQQQQQRQLQMMPPNINISMPSHNQYDSEIRSIANQQQELHNILRQIHNNPQAHGVPQGVAQHMVSSNVQAQIGSNAQQAVQAMQQANTTGRPINNPPVNIFTTPHKPSQGPSRGVDRSLFASDVLAAIDAGTIDNTATPAKPPPKAPPAPKAPDPSAPPRRGRPPKSEVIEPKPSLSGGLLFSELDLKNQASKLKKPNPKPSTPSKSSSAGGGGGLIFSAADLGDQRAKLRPSKPREEAPKAPPTIHEQVINAVVSRRPGISGDNPQYDQTTQKYIDTQTNEIAKYYNDKGIPNSGNIAGAFKAKLTRKGKELGRPLTHEEISKINQEFIGKQNKKLFPAAAVNKT